MGKVVALCFVARVFSCQIHNVRVGALFEQELDGWQEFVLHADVESCEAVRVDIVDVCSSHDQSGSHCEVIVLQLVLKNRHAVCILLVQVFRPQTQVIYNLLFLLLSCEQQGCLSSRIMHV